MIEQIYLSLILVGLTIGAVLIYLWRQAHHSNTISLALIRLNEQHDFDAPTLLRAAWPLLSDAGLMGMRWQLDWFGTLVEGNNGADRGEPITEHIHVADMRLTVTIYRKRTRGERRYFEETLIATFLLLLRTDMWIKAGATDATMRHMGRLNLFLQHDTKNIAQFIQLLADQVADIPVGREHLILQHLRTAAPLVRQRADRIVRTLTLGTPQAETPRQVYLHELLEQLCIFYRLEADIQGTGEIHAPQSVIDSALDNIIKNYQDLALRGVETYPRLSIRITENADDVSIAIESPVAAGVAPERLFEPFWSNNPAGLGIGLYQARQLLTSCGGSVDAIPLPNGALAFDIRLPRRSRECSGISTCK